MMRLLGVVGLAVALIAPVSAAQAQAAAPYCGIRWGSLDKNGGNYETYLDLHRVRAGRHACFDRLVIDLSSRFPALYSVGYVDQVRNPDGSSPPQLGPAARGTVIPTRGGARLAVFVSAKMYSDGQLVYRPANPAELVDVRGWRTFRQVAFGAHAYGATIGLGVRARLPYRVFTLSGPGQESRLVIDVAHRW
ncbi:MULTISPECIES: AMIN-like domain-containing (lipo)protein [Kribbella]